jgi:hypothetical protein
MISVSKRNSFFEIFARGAEREKEIKVTLG